VKITVHIQAVSSCPREHHTRTAGFSLLHTFITLIRLLSSLLTADKVLDYYWSCLSAVGCRMYRLAVSTEEQR